MDDRRTLITQLCDELDHNRRMLLDDRQVTHPLADRARAVLDRPEPEGLTDDKLMDIARATGLVYYMGKGGFASRYQEDTDITAEVLAFARAVLVADGPAVPEGREPASVMGEPSDAELLGIAAQAIEPYDKIRPGEYEAENNCAIEVYSSELITFARAVIARYGHQPAPPAEGEVGELVAEQLPDLRRRLESVVKSSRSYDGYSTMTPVELADRIIDAVVARLPAHALPLPAEEESDG